MLTKETMDNIEFDIRLLTTEYLDGTVWQKYLNLPLINIFYNFHKHKNLNSYVICKSIIHFTNLMDFSFDTHFIRGKFNSIDEI